MNAGQPPNACSDVRFKHLTCLVSRESGLSSVLSWFREPNLQETELFVTPNFYPLRCVRWAPLEALVTSTQIAIGHSSNVLRRRRRIIYDARRSSSPTPSLQAFEKNEENKSGARETRTSTVNPSAIKVLTRWDSLSYPESHPRQSRAATGPLGIGWARMSMHRDYPLPASLTHWAGVDPKATVTSVGFLELKR